MGSEASTPAPPGVTAPAAAPLSGRCRRAWRAVTRRPLRTLAVLALLAVIGLACVPVVLYGWALYHFRAGQADMARFHSVEAYHHLQSSLVAWPRDPDTLLLTARAARRSSAFDDAERYLEAYQAVRGQDDRWTLEEVLLRAERGDVDAVGGFCRARLDADDPSAPLILEALARGCLRSLRGPDAVHWLEEWLRRQPDNPLALFLQGTVESDRGNLQGAVAAYRDVLRVDPEADESRLRLAGLLLDLTQYAEALPHLEYLRPRQRDHPKVVVNLARCYDHLNRGDDARALLDAALARHPHDALLLAERGKVALRDGDLAGAESWLREACALEPGDHDAHYQLYQCLSQQPAKAAEAQELQARLQQIEADVRRMRDIVTAEMAKAPHDPDLDHEAGVILLRAGMPDEALRWFGQALKEDPRHGPTHQALADYYERTGNPRLAAEHRKLAPPPGGR
jgi:tetratricopeptide (TPR) repeat protein